MSNSWEGGDSGGAGGGGAFNQLWHTVISWQDTQCGQTLMYVSLGVSSRKYNFLLSVCFVTINCQNWKISTKIRPTAHADTG